jgi:hypothetical protein
MTDNSPRPHHLNLAVGGDDVARTTDFYRNLLGLTPFELPRDRESYDAAIATLQDRWGYQYQLVAGDGACWKPLSYSRRYPKNSRSLTTFSCLTNAVMRRREPLPSSLTSCISS